LILFTTIAIPEFVAIIEQTKDGEVHLRLDEIQPVTAIVQFGCIVTWCELDDKFVSEYVYQAFGDLRGDKELIGQLVLDLHLPVS